MDDSAIMEMESVPINNSKVDEAALNSVLKSEIDKINQSLAKIT